MEFNEPYRRLAQATLPAIIAVTIGGLFFIAGQNMQTIITAKPDREITMSGTGTVKIEPTIARFTISVETIKPHQTPRERLGTIQK